MVGVGDVPDVGGGVDFTGVVGVGDVPDVGGGGVDGTGIVGDAKATSAG
ncbi:MAG: hypothetical protein ACOH1Y_00360 [Propionicimonas sp.]